MTWGLRLTDRLADRTTHVSKMGLAVYLEKRVVSPDRAAWMPNGIDLHRFNEPRRNKAASRHGLGIPDEQFLWLTVGRLSDQKAQSRLIRAFAGVAKNAELAIAGEGPALESLVNLAVQLSVRDRVHFLGLRTDTEVLMRAADAFVLSSSWEGLPLVLMEAAATRIPIVTTDVGGCREIVKDGVNGFLVDSLEPASLAQTMSRTMDLPEAELIAMGASGRRLVEQRYDIDRVVDRWEDFYDSLAATNGGKGS